MATSESTGVRINRVLYRLTQRWLRIALVLIGIYITLPFAAPVLMRLGATRPAALIYGMYSPLCHQFAFRSWFLFGEQPAYPRASANVPGLRPIEDYTAALIDGRQVSPDTNLTQWSPFLLEVSREFIGNPQMGWKVALCERDVAIYGALFIGGLLFAIPDVRSRLRPVPLWLYVLVGIVPIAIDGGVQLLSEPPLALFAARETTPLFRTFTGALFGLMNAWLAFPYLEESFRMTASEIAAKFAQRGKAL
jgi:uncharacterized membrane protein